MASLHEYFVKDASANFTIHKTVPMVDQKDGSVSVEVVARLHLDFAANAKFVSFYVPATDKVACPEAILLNSLEEILNWTETEVILQAGFPSEKTDGRQLVFTGRVYLYTERPTRDQHKERILKEAEAAGHAIIFRSEEYVQMRNKWEKPLAFISHDSRDKELVAERLAVELQKLMCPVWYDQFSLKVGDSLRESIELGLKECKKCILILTPHFLSNIGWTKREYDSIFTRELVEKQKVILPVWSEVSSREVYAYSPILADRVAVNWSLGAQEVARRLLSVISEN